MSGTHILAPIVGIEINAHRVGRENGYSRKEKKTQKTHGQTDATKTQEL